jgi:hypothetical protein
MLMYYNKLNLFLSIMPGEKRDGVSHLNVFGKLPGLPPHEKFLNTSLYGRGRVWIKLCPCG